LEVLQLLLLLLLQLHIPTAVALLLVVLLQFYVLTALLLQGLGDGWACLHLQPINLLLLLQRRRLQEVLRLWASGW
jgi:hypothetical protein